MQISYVADTFELATSLILGLLDHWGAIAPQDTWDARLGRLRLHMNRDQLPIAWLAHDGARAFGTAALRVHDLPGREDLGPWLGGVYVAPEFRRRGVASLLCGTVEERARSLGYRRIYLFTLDMQLLYTRLGWLSMERSSWSGRPADIMTKELVTG
jgi:GNAT superfamily N-acetyltransferase